MEMMAFVLVSVVAVLISPQAAKSTNNINLKHIVYLIKTLNESYFVEDVTDLANNGCENNFFCKVRDILNKHNGIVENKIVRNLDVYLYDTQVNCKEELKNVRVTTNEKRVLVLLTKLEDCIHRRNFNGKSNQNA